MSSHEYVAWQPQQKQDHPGGKETYDKASPSGDIDTPEVALRASSAGTRELASYPRSSLLFWSVCAQTFHIPVFTALVRQTCRAAPFAIDQPYAEPRPRLCSHRHDARDGPPPDCRPPQQETTPCFPPPPAPQASLLREGVSSPTFFAETARAQRGRRERAASTQANLALNEHSAWLIAPPRPFCAPAARAPRSSRSRKHASDPLAQG